MWLTELDEGIAALVRDLHNRPILREYLSKLPLVTVHGHVGNVDLSVRDRSLSHHTIAVCSKVLATLVEAIWAVHTIWARWCCCSGRIRVLYLASTAIVVTVVRMQWTWVVIARRGRSHHHRRGLNVRVHDTIVIFIIFHGWAATSLRSAAAPLSKVLVVVALHLYVVCLRAVLRGNGSPSSKFKC